MRRQLLTIAAVLFACSPVFGELTITSIFDGQGDTPRGVELYVGATGSFENWALEIEFNDNLDPSADEFGVGYVFDSTIYNEGDFIYVTGDPTDSTLTATSGIIIDAPTFGFLTNGDDRVRIKSDAGTVIDQYGVSGLDGTGQPWEYDGSFAYRNDDTSASGVFEISNWTIASLGSLDSNGNGALSSSLGTYSFTAVPEPSSLLLAGLAAMGFGFRRRRN